MNLLPISLLSISQSAATTFVTALWQGAIIALCLAVCLKFAPRTSAALRFALWAAGFVLVVALPFLPLVLPHWNIAQPAAHVSYAQPARPLFELDLRWSLLISALWAAASLYRAADLALHVVRLRKLWNSAIPVHSNLNPSTHLVNLRRPVQLCTTQELDRPAVIGFFAPRILIPEWLIAKLTPGELDQIVLHESEHLRRGDDWTNLLQKLSLVLFPLNPVLLWMERRLCLEREMACDDGVVRVTRAPRAYATCLTSLAERGLHHRAEALSLGVLRRRPELVQRVHSLLRHGRSDGQVLGPIGSRSLAAAVTCAMAFGVVELSRCPQLVAFEITPHSTTNSIVARGEEAIPASHVKAATPSINAGYKVVYAKAVQPTTESRPVSAPRRLIAVHSTCSRTALKNQPVQVAAVEKPAQLLAVQAMPVIARTTSEPYSEQSAATPTTQSYIVLTTWEQESTLPDAGSSDVASDHPASRTIITRTIFRVIPARAVTVRHTGTNSTSPSPETTPALLPSPDQWSRDGWLVLDL
jgi:beta-lactamase regulating signal transducer with metallopeptidase domain